MRDAGFAWGRTTLLLGMVLLTGCVHAAKPDEVPPAALTIPPLGVGDWARYVDAFGTLTLDVLVRGLHPVLDADGTIVPALLIDRWVNHTSPAIRTREVEAVDPATGRLYWVARLCAFPRSDATCPDHTAFFTGVRGAPGQLGRTWLEVVARDAGLRDRLVREGACVTVLGREPPMGGVRLFTFEPPGLLSDGEATFCRDSPFPRTFRATNGVDFSRVESTGGGDALPSPDGTSLRALPEARGEHWDRRTPPRAEWPSAFGWVEAWDWLAANSSEFQAFRRDHPDAYLHSTYLTGGASFSSNVPVADGYLDHRLYRRQVTLQSPTGEALVLRLEKQEKAGGFPPEVLQTDARRGTGVVTLRPEAAPSVMVPPREVVAHLMARVDGAYKDAHVLTSLEGPDGQLVTTDTLYLYRVLLRPPGVTEETPDYFSYLAVARSDTGGLVYVVAPPGFGFA